MEYMKVPPEMIQKKVGPNSPDLLCKHL